MKIRHENWPEEYTLELEFYSSDWAELMAEHERKEFLRTEKARKKLLGMKDEIEEEEEE